MATLIWQRDVADVKSTFSSWDKCMTKTYCKWPVIAGIIVGSLILLSVIICVSRCICCGAECACCCFKCCAGCCGSGRGKHKRMDSSSAPPPLPGGYQPAFPSTPVNSQYRSHATPALTPSREKPQYATFESPSKPVNEDALPHMPSWNDATSRKVEEEVVPEKPGDVELNNLDHRQGSVSDPMVAGAAGGPLRSPAKSPVYRSPSHQDGYPSPNLPNAGYAGRPSQSRSRMQDSFHSRQQNGVVDQYGNQQPGYGNRMMSNSPAPASPVHDGGFYGQGQQYGRNSPRPSVPNHEYGRSSPRPGVQVRPDLQNHDYGRSSPRLPVQNQEYRGVSPMPMPMPMPSPNQEYGRSSPMPPNQEYGRNSPQPVIGGAAAYNNGRSTTPEARGYGAPYPAPGRVNSPLAPHPAYEAPQVSPYQDARNNYAPPEPYAELDTGYTAPKPYAELAANYTAPQPYAELAASNPSTHSHGYALSGSTRFEAPSPYQQSYQQPQELDSGIWPIQHQQQQYNGDGRQPG